MFEILTFCWGLTPVNHSNRSDIISRSITVLELTKSCCYIHVKLYYRLIFSLINYHILGEVEDEQHKDILKPHISVLNIMDTCTTDQQDTNTFTLLRRITRYIACAWSHDGKLVYWYYIMWNIREILLLSNSKLRYRLPIFPLIIIRFYSSYYFLQTKIQLRWNTCVAISIKSRLIYSAIFNIYWNETREPALTIKSEPVLEFLCVGKQYKTKSGFRSCLYFLTNWQSCLTKKFCRCESESTQPISKTSPDNGQTDR